jgi:hypothetical protein
LFHCFVHLECPLAEAPCTSLVCPQEPTTPSTPSLHLVCNLSLCHAILWPNFWSPGPTAFLSCVELPSCSKCFKYLSDLVMLMFPHSYCVKHALLVSPWCETTMKAPDCHCKWLLALQLLVFWRWWGVLLQFLIISLRCLKLQQRDAYC